VNSLDIPAYYVFMLCLENNACLTAAAATAVSVCRLKKCCLQTFVRTSPRSLRRIDATRRQLFIVPAVNKNRSVPRSQLTTVSSILVYCCHQSRLYETYLCIDDVMIQPTCIMSVRCLLNVLSPTMHWLCRWRYATGVHRSRSSLHALCRSPATS
jgi:hypothetical protein